MRRRPCSAEALPWLESGTEGFRSAFDPRGHPSPPAPRRMRRNPTRERKVIIRTPIKGAYGQAVLKHKVQVWWSGDNCWFTERRKTI